jgi:phospholipid N-methyltransferase
MQRDNSEDVPMLNLVEKERIEQLENEIVRLREDVEMQQILLSGLLHSVLRGESSNQSAFLNILREELNKLPPGSLKRQEFTYKLQELIERYR